MDVGERIRIKREELGLTQDELAKKLGYKSRSSVNKMENSRELPLKKVAMMAKVLGCSPAYLMGWDIKQPKTYSSDRYITFPDSMRDLLDSVNGNAVPYNPTMITHRFQNILNKLGIKHFRFHDLRHYSVSIQHALGVPDAYIQQRGGWSTNNVMNTVYRHIMDDEGKKQNEKANNFFDSIINKD